MKDNNAFNFIARIYTDFPAKFGIPRQSGLIPEALRGLEGFSHLWLLWKFSENEKSDWSPTVRPPRLGGNTRLGVFATRSPFRPNPIGLSCVKLEKITEDAENGAVLEVSGADILSGTPIYDIKPYIPYTDCIPDASGGFAAQTERALLKVELPESLAAKTDDSVLIPLKKVLANDPRPAYHNDPTRIYAFEFANLRVKFKVNSDTLTVISLEEARGAGAPSNM